MISISDREKLIELIESARYWGCGTSEEIADSLLANGVTIQRWIPVTERLPEKGADVLMYFHKSKTFASGFWHGEEDADAVYWCAYSDDGWYTDCDTPPTHWMPLPQPPKEDTCESKHTKP